MPKQTPSFQTYIKVSIIDSKLVPFPLPSNFPPPIPISPSPQLLSHLLQSSILCSGIPTSAKIFLTLKHTHVHRLITLLFMLVSCSLYILTISIIKHIVKSLQDQDKYSALFLYFHHLAQRFIKINSKIFKVLSVYSYSNQFPHFSLKNLFYA